MIHDPTKIPLSRMVWLYSVNRRRKCDRLRAAQTLFMVGFSQLAFEQKRDLQAKQLPSLLEFVFDVKAQRVDLELAKIAFRRLGSGDQTPVTTLRLALEIGWCGNAQVSQEDSVRIEETIKQLMSIVEDLPSSIPSKTDL